MTVLDIVNCNTNIKEKNIISNDTISGAYLDSRLVTKNSIFFCVKGENTDGNLYGKVAKENGSSLVIFDNEKYYNEFDGNKILVDDTVTYIYQLGKYNLDNYKGKKIVVTGSFGKTGTKEMLKQVFSYTGKVYGTVGNKNNLLGVSLTACGIDDSPISVFEIGSNNPGEIEDLSKLIKPDVAIVTSVGHAHVGRFNGLENVIKEKISVIEGLKDNGVLILPYSIKKYLPSNIKAVTFGSHSNADIFIKDMKHNGDFITFNVNDSNEKFKINHPYIHIAEGVLPIIASCRIFNINDEKISKAIENYKPIKGRGNIEKYGNITIIDDTYNAGFEAIIRSCESLNEINISPKYAIYGETGEIEGFENEIYNNVISLSEKYKDINFIFVGDEYTKFNNTDNRKIYKNKEDATNEVKSIKKGVILVKASRSKKFEYFINEIKSEVR